MTDTQQTFDPAQANKANANFQITNSGSEVFLCVHPHPTGEEPVKESAVILELQNQGIKDFDYALVTNTIKEAAGTQVKIAAIAPPAEPQIEIKLSKDKMEATLEIILPENSLPISIEKVKEKIQEKGIIFGIDEAAIQKACKQPGVEVVFAQGQAAVNGTDAYIKHHVSTEHKGQPIETDHGRVDYKNLSWFTIVHTGQLLAEKIAATPGTDGTDITGTTLLPKVGKDIPLPIGKNVEVANDNQIIATLSGQFLIANNKINVVPVLEIKEDVDLSTGNIDFIGDVIVRGSIQSGFSVKADGNVEVHGAVSGTIEGKNITVKTGVLGMHQGYIKARGNVVATFLENAEVTALGDVIISDVILHSRVKAGNRIVVEGKRGLIAGGYVIAGKEIRAKVIGTQLSANTDVEVGVNPILREEFENLRNELKKTETNLDQTQKGLAILRTMDQSTMPESKREMLLKLTKANFNLAGQMEHMRKRMAEIETELEEMRAGKIKVADVIYPGVKLVVGTLSKSIREPVKYASVYAEDGDIKIGVYK